VAGASFALAQATYPGRVGKVVIVVIVVVLSVYTLFDVLAADRRRVRGMPKPLWAILALLPLLGPAFWVALGRPQTPRGPQPGERRTVAPDDDPDFLWRLDRKRRHKPDDDGGS
jgi:Phospholipase_D-nuclease N-terminal